MTHTARTTLFIVGLAIATGLTAGATPAQAQDRAWAREIEASVRAQVDAIRDNVRRFAWRADDREWVRDMLRDLNLQLRGARRFDGRGEEATEAFSRTARLGRTGTLDLQNIAGDIVITGGGGDSVRIEATKRVRARDAAEARARLGELRIEVAERPERVEVRTEYPRRRDFFGSVDFTVAVPSGAGVTVQSVSGNIRVTNVDGELRMQSVSGNLVASAVKGLARVRSVSGDVEVSKAEGANVTGGTMSGELVLTGLRAKDVELQSVSGDMRLADVEVDRAYLRSVTGDVEYRGRLARAGRYELQSHSGDVRVTPREAGFELDAGTFNGDVRSDYELKVQGTSANAAAARSGNLRERRGRVGRGRGLGQRLRGASGEGGAMLVLQSFSGDIEITKQ